MDQELANAAVYAPGRRCVCTHQRQHFSAWNDVLAAFLKVWRQLENPTTTIDAYLLKNNPAKFHPDPIWNKGAL